MVTSKIHIIRIIAIITVVAFVFTNCGLGYACPPKSQWRALDSTSKLRQMNIEEGNYTITQSLGAELNPRSEGKGIGKRIDLKRFNAVTTSEFNGMEYRAGVLGVSLPDKEYVVTDVSTNSPTTIKIRPYKVEDFLVLGYVSPNDILENMCSIRNHAINNNMSGGLLLVAVSGPEDKPKIEGVAYFILEKDRKALGSIFQEYSKGDRKKIPDAVLSLIGIAVRPENIFTPAKRNTGLSGVGSALMTAVVEASMNSPAIPESQRGALLLKGASRMSSSSNDPATYYDFIGMEYLPKTELDRREDRSKNFYFSPEKGREFVSMHFSTSSAIAAPAAGATSEARSDIPSGQQIDTAVREGAKAVQAGLPYPGARISAGSNAINSLEVVYEPDTSGRFPNGFAVKRVKSVANAQTEFTNMLILSTTDSFVQPVALRGRDVVMEYIPGVRLWDIAYDKIPAPAGRNILDELEALRLKISKESLVTQEMTDKVVQAVENSHWNFTEEQTIELRKELLKDKEKLMADLSGTKSILVYPQDLNAANILVTNEGLRIIDPGLLLMEGDSQSFYYSWIKYYNFDAPEFSLAYDFMSGLKTAIEKAGARAAGDSIELMAHQALKKTATHCRQLAVDIRAKLAEGNYGEIVNLCKGQRKKLLEFFKTEKSASYDFTPLIMALLEDGVLYHITTIAFFAGTNLENRSGLIKNSLDDLEQVLLAAEELAGVGRLMDMKRIQKSSGYFDISKLKPVSAGAAGAAGKQSLRRAIANGVQRFNVFVGKQFGFLHRRSFGSIVLEKCRIDGKKYLRMHVLDLGQGTKSLIRDMGDLLSEIAMQDFEKEGHVGFTGITLNQSLANFVERRGFTKNSVKENFWSHPSLYLNLWVSRKILGIYPASADDSLVEVKATFKDIEGSNSWKKLQQTPGAAGNVAKATGFEEVFLKLREANRLTDELLARETDLVNLLKQVGITAEDLKVIDFPDSKNMPDNVKELIIFFIMGGHIGSLFEILNMQEQLRHDLFRKINESGVLALQKEFQKLKEGGFLSLADFSEDKQDAQLYMRVSQIQHVIPTMSSIDQLEELINFMQRAAQLGQSKFAKTSAGAVVAADAKGKRQPSDRSSAKFPGSIIDKRAWSIGALLQLHLIGKEGTSEDITTAIRRVQGVVKYNMGLSFKELSGEKISDGNYKFILVITGKRETGEKGRRKYIITFNRDTLELVKVDAKTVFVEDCRRQLNLIREYIKESQDTPEVEREEQIQEYLTAITVGIDGLVKELNVQDIKPYMEDKLQYSIISMFASARQYKTVIKMLEAVEAVLVELKNIDQASFLQAVKEFSATAGDVILANAAAEATNEHKEGYYDIKKGSIILRIHNGPLNEEITEVISQAVAETHAYIKAQEITISNNCFQLNGYLQEKLININKSLVQTGAVLSCPDLKKRSRNVKLSKYWEHSIWSNHGVAYVIMDGLHLAIDVTARSYINDSDIDADIFVGKDRADLERKLMANYGGVIWQTEEEQAARELSAALLRFTAGGVDGVGRKVEFDAGSRNSSDLIASPWLLAEDIRLVMIEDLKAAFSPFMQKDVLYRVLYHFAGLPAAMPLSDFINNAVNAIKKRSENDGAAVKNTIKFEIYIDKPKSTFKLVLSDTGIGIDRSILEQIEKGEVIESKKSPGKFLGGSGVGAQLALRDIHKIGLGIVFESKCKDKPAYSLIQTEAGERIITDKCDKQDVGVTITIEGEIPKIVRYIEAKMEAEERARAGFKESATATAGAKGAGAVVRAGGAESLAAANNAGQLGMTPGASANAAAQAGTITAGSPVSSRQSQAAIRARAEGEVVFPIDTSAIPDFKRFIFPKGAAYGSRWNWAPGDFYDNGKFHRGVDIFLYETTDGAIGRLSTGTTVRAVCSGKALNVSKSSFGDEVIIETADGNLIEYAHIKTDIVEGQQVISGEKLGVLFNYFDQPHLHLEIYKNDGNFTPHYLNSQPNIDPMKFWPELFVDSFKEVDDTIEAVVEIPATASAPKPLARPAPDGGARATFGLRASRANNTRSEYLELLKAKVREDAGGKDIYEGFNPLDGVEGPDRQHTDAFKGLIAAVKNGQPIALDLSGYETMDRREIFEAIRKLFLSIYSNFGDEFAWAYPWVGGRIFDALKPASFSIRELLKNALYHGNGSNFKLPIFLYLDLKNHRLLVYDTACVPPLHAGLHSDMGLARKAGFVGERKGIFYIEEIYHLNYSLEALNISGQKIGTRAIVAWPIKARADGGAAEANAAAQAVEPRIAELIKQLQSAEHPADVLTQLEQEVHYAINRELTNDERRKAEELLRMSEDIFERGMQAARDGGVGRFPGLAEEGRVLIDNWDHFFPNTYQNAKLLLSFINSARQALDRNDGSYYGEKVRLIEMIYYTFPQPLSLRRYLAQVMLNLLMAMPFDIESNSLQTLSLCDRIELFLKYDFEKIDTDKIIGGFVSDLQGLGWRGRLQARLPVIINAVDSLEVLWEIQKLVGKREIVFSVLPFKNKEGNLIFLAPGEEKTNYFAFGGISLRLGHTHVWKIPIKPSGIDSYAAPLLGKSGSFILAFGQEDKHVELAIFNQNEGRWEYIVDQNLVADKLKEIGLLSSITSVGNSSAGQTANAGKTVELITDNEEVVNKKMIERIARKHDVSIKDVLVVQVNDDNLDEINRAIYGAKSADIILLNINQEGARDSVISALTAMHVSYVDLSGLKEEELKKVVETAV